MHSETKSHAPSSNFEVDSQDLQLQSKVRTLATVEAGRTSLAVVALLMAVTILGLSADALSVYNNTHLPSSFDLPLWPAEFNIRPMIALVVCGALVLVFTTVSLVAGKVNAIRHRTAVHTPISLAAPLLGLIAAVIATAFFYTVESSNEVDSLHSWSCRWQSVGMMTTPYFGTLCKQSQAAITLSIFLIPIEAIALGVSAYAVVLDRSLSGSAPSRKTASPVGN